MNEEINNNFDDNINNDNNQNDNNNNNFVNQNDSYIKNYSNVTISFLIILMINLLIEIYSYFKAIDSRKYVFQFAPIYEKNQFYRLVTCYFIHYGFWHLVIELYITYKICNFMENLFGTIITISFIMESIITNSFLNLLLIKFMLYICNLIHYPLDISYNYESSLTSVLFTMATFFFSFKFISKKKINILYTIVITAKYIGITAFFSILIFTPNKSFFSNLSGLLNGYIFKLLPFPFLPRVNWVRDFEKKYKFKSFKRLNIYRSITKKNISMVIALNELQKYSMINENVYKNNIKENYQYSNNFNANGPQMTELSNSINNIRNDESSRNLN
jgi:membrane associated rhomboid family serine protease